MRLLVIVVGVLLATVSANPVEVEADLEEDGTDLDIEDVEGDLGEILQGLFDARDSRDVEEETDAVASEEESESLQEQEEEQIISPQEVARFNNYMDAIYRRMNAALRAKMMDPMTLNLNQKIKKENEKNEKINHREVREAQKEEISENNEEDEQDEVSVDRMGKLSKKKGKNTGKGERKGSKIEKEKTQKKGKKKGQKNNKMKKNDKKKSNLTREERKKKKQENKKKREDKKKNKTNKGEKREERSGKNKNGNKHNKKHSKAQKGKDKKGKGKGQNHGGNKARDGKEEGPAMGSLSGMATLRRDGDVQIKNAENHKVVKSHFSVGPLALEVSKKYGSGKGRTVRTARAKTAVMQGVMQLKVKEDGSAHILSVVFKKPEDVAVTGSISDNRKRSDNFVKNSVNKMRPLAAQKILKTARYVLKAPHSKKTE